MSVTTEHMYSNIFFKAVVPPYGNQLFFPLNVSIHNCTRHLLAVQVQ